MNDWTDSANYHAAAACHGIDALHAQAPDELMMQMEEAQGEPARRREAERQRAARGDPDCPLGMRRLTEAERAETLAALDAQEREAQRLLLRVPLRVRFGWLID